MDRQNSADSGTLGSNRRRRDLAELGYEEDMEQLLFDLDNDYTPTSKQEATMRGLCKELGLSYKAEADQLTTAEVYSNRIGELLKQKHEKCKTQQEVTPAQQHYLRVLKMKPSEMKNLNKTSASALIQEKVAEKEGLPPTPAQLKLLQQLEHKGATPKTRCLASRMMKC